MNITLDTAFVLGGLYYEALNHDKPLWFTKRTFDNGSCEVWCGVVNIKGYVGSWLGLGYVDAAALDDYLQACLDFLDKHNQDQWYRGKTPVKVIDWDTLKEISS